MVDTLKVGPYVFKIVPLYGGPLLDAQGEGEAVARLLNYAVTPPETHLAEDIRGATEVGNKEIGNADVSAGPAADGEEDRALRAEWAAKTGERCGPGAVACVRQSGLARHVPISWAALQQGLAELLELRAGWRPEPGPWLFARPTLRPFVTPEDFQIIRSLEQEAEAIDKLDLEAEVGREPAALVERRRKFLAACRDAGVFAPDHGKVREQWLYNWSAERLSALRAAFVSLRGWGLLNEGEELPDGRVCLDYVRLKLWPPGEDGESLARSVLGLLPAASEGEQGAVIERVGASAIRVWWRRDGGRPALLAIASG